MDQLQTAPEIPLGSSPNPLPQTPNLFPGWYKCLHCDDYGTCCNGPSLGSLGDIASAREFHKAVRRAKGKHLKDISSVATSISEHTVNEYFSNAAKDYKLATVMAIDNALTAICGNRVGQPPLLHACPASSAEVKQQLAAADLKVAAAEMRATQAEAEAREANRKLADIKGRQIAQLAHLEESHAKDMEWMKNDIRMWRRFAFILLGIGIVFLVMLVFYFCVDAAHPASGLIRY